MSLIHNDIGHIHIPEILLEETRGETLWGYIEKLAVSVGGVVEGKVNVISCHSGIDGDGAYAAVIEVLNLILHQGYERSDDKG